MITRTCDRCRTLIPGAQPYGVVAYGHQELPLNQQHRDLCQACLTALAEWLRPKEATR